MFLLGILSLLQITFLPGYLLLRILRLRPGGIAELLVSIPLSMVVNHFLVVGLVLARCYVPVAMYVVLAIEVAAIGFLAWRQGRRTDELQGNSDLRRFSVLAETIRSTGATGAITWWALIWLAGGILLVHVAAAVQNIGTVFEWWDAVVSWNRWATSWANNAFPWLTWRYPQLLPSNISVGYVVLGQSWIQLFVKAAMGLFPVAQLLMLADLAVRRRNAAYLAALSLVGVMNLLTVRDGPVVLLMSGCADLPVAYMITASLYLLILAEEAVPARERLRWLVLSIVVAAGAALTKQAGLLWAAVAPIIAALEWRRLQTTAAAPSVPTPRARAVLATLGLFAAISLALAGPWYAYRLRQIRSGREPDESLMVAAASGQYTYGERVRLVYERLETESSPWLVRLLPLALLGALLSSRWRLPALLYAVPYAAICVGLVNYDLRNFASAWPVLFMSGAAGWAEVLARRRAPWAALPAPFRLRRVQPMLVGGVLAASTPLALLGPHLSDERLGNLQVQKQRQIGFAALNEAIYEYDHEHKLRGKIVTDYQPFEYLPGIGSRYVFDDFRDLERLHRVAAEPENRYLLVPMPFLMTTRQPVLEFVEAELTAGRFRLILQSFGYRLVEIVEREG